MKIEEMTTFSHFQIEDPSFRYGFCLKSGFRFEQLNQYCEQLIFVTDGRNTNIDHMQEALIKSFSKFDPLQDVIIPTGTGIMTLMTGYLLREQFSHLDVNIAFFQKMVVRQNRVVVPESYIFYRIPLWNFF